MNRRPLPAFDLATQIATWFGCGFAPIAPGTAGSLAAIIIGVVCERFFHWPPLVFLALAALLFMPGVWAATRVARRLNVEDPGLVVVDEVIGQWITIAGALTLNWKSWLGAFLLFRLFDIWKPFPIRRLEALPEGLGIVTDDCMAGFYGAVVIFVAGKWNLY